MPAGVRVGSRDSKGKMDSPCTAIKMTQSGGLPNPDLVAWAKEPLL